MSESSRSRILRFACVMMAVLVVLAHPAIIGSVSAVGDGEFTIDVEHKNGNQADEVNALIIYQDGSYYDEIKNYPGVDLKHTFSNLPTGHDYKVDAYIQDQFAGSTGPITIPADNTYTPWDESSKSDQITAENPIELSPTIYYSDGSTPIEGASVRVKSHEDDPNYVWRTATTESDGETDPSPLSLYPTDGDDQGKYTVEVLQDGEKISSGDYDELNTDADLKVITDASVPEYDLSASADPSYAGDVDGEPFGSVEQGTEIQLTADPDSGHEFDHWSGDYPSGSREDADISVTVTEDKSLTAHFEEIPEYDLSVSSSSGGTVETSNTGSIQEGTDVSLTADATQGYKFSHWSGDYPSGSREDADISVTMYRDRELTANFEKLEGDLTVDVRHQNGDRAEEVNALVVWQDEVGGEPYKKFENDRSVAIKQKINNLPGDHRYKVNAYINDQFAGATDWVNIKNSDKSSTIRVENPVWIKPTVYYTDGSTPLEDATVKIESHEGTEWRSSTTEEDGLTNPGKLWLFPTNKGHYDVQVYSEGTRVASKTFNSLDSNRDLRLVTSVSPPTQIDTSVVGRTVREETEQDGTITVGERTEVGATIRNDGTKMPLRVVFQFDTDGDSEPEAIDISGDSDPERVDYDEDGDNEPGTVRGNVEKTTVPEGEAQGFGLEYTPDLAGEWQVRAVIQAKPDTEWVETDETAWKQYEVEQNLGKITGTVTGPDGTPITGARVYLDSGSRQTRTNDSGKFSFAEVTAKGHQIRIVTVEYDPKTISITVGGGEEVTRQIRLGDTSVRPADVSVSLSTVNNRQYNGGVLETSSVRNLTVEVTGPNGITVRGADAKINPVIAPDQSEQYSFETRKVSAGTFRFSTEDYSISSGTGYQYYRIALQIEDESITRVISIPVISGRDELQTPIEGWRAGHLDKPVIVDEQRYTAVWMSRFDYQRENPNRPAYTWVIYDQNGQLVTDSETVRKAAQAATISALYTSDELERFLSKEYPKKLKRLVRIDQSIQFAELVRDTSAETLGAVANAYVTGGSGVAAKEATGSAAKLTAKKATKLAAEKLAKKIVIAIDDNDVSPSAFLQDPMGTYERVTRKIAFAEMRASAVQSRQAGAVLRGHPDNKPWSYEESQKFWQNYNESMTDGTLYSQARGERLSGSNTPTDTLKNIGLNFAEGATGPVPVTTLKSYADFVNLLKNGKLGKGMEAAVANTASIRQDMAVAQQSFDGRPVDVANKLQAAGGTTLDSESPPDRSKSATVAIQQLPRGPISKGKTADLTVSVTNTGSSTDRFFVGYSVAVDSGKATTYYDNKGTTGKFVTIKPAETRTIELSWTASENVPQNVNYNIVTAVWSDLPSKAATLHDKTRRKDVFKVESTGKISITQFNAPERTTQGTVELTTTIKNTQSFGTRVGVVVQDGDQRLGNTSVLFVPANGERTVTLDPKLEATGTRQLQIIAGDQQATATDTVEVVSDFVVDITEVSNPAVGERLEVTAEITNTGDQTGEATIQLDTTAGEIEPTQTTVNLGGGDSTTETLTVDTTGVDPGSYTATVTASAGTGTETDENPGDAASFEIAAAPVEFQLEFLEGPTQIITGESYSPTVEVTNNGAGAGTQDISYVLENPDGLSTGIEAIEPSVELAAGESEQITFDFEAQETDALSTGTYNHVFKSADDESVREVELEAGFSIAQFDRNDTGQIEFDDLRYATREYNRENITFDQLRRVLRAYNTDQQV